VADQLWQMTRIRERGRGAFVTFMISLRRIQMFLLTFLLCIREEEEQGTDHHHHHQFVA